VKRTRLFKIIAVLLPVLALCLLEGTLRLCHYGRDLRLFIPYPPDERYLVFNPDASQRYFSNQDLATTGNVEPFLKEKAPGSLRIFVLGESTTIGYPYFHNGSFHRWLQYRLMRTFPGKTIEVINLSLTAVNSYTVEGFARELADYAPDAVLIYTGHNEYYGALGVGSTERLGGNPAVIHAILWLRGLRTVQLIGRVVSSLGGHKADAGRTRMEMMVREENIPLHSPLYERGIAQFERNMRQALVVLQAHHIPVFLSNLVSNEKDMQPFISAPVDSVRYPVFAHRFAAGLRALAKLDSTGANRDFEAADSAFPGHALCNYYLGRLAFGRGDTVTAKRRFDLARSLDELRFRAPDTLNTLIAALCQETGAHLVDTRAAFENASPGGCIGAGLLLEHVHPNLNGYALMSDVFYRALETQGIVRVPPGQGMSLAQLMAAMPITRVDSLVGVYKIWNLKNTWPFSQGLAQDLIRAGTEEEELAFSMAFRHMPWSTAMSDLYDYYIKEHDLSGARTVMESLVLEHPTEAAYSEKTGNICGELKDYGDAIYYFGKAFREAPTFDIAHYLFVMNLQLDRPEEALPYIDYAIRNNPRNMDLAPVRYYTDQVISLRAAYARDTSNPAALPLIAAAYRKMGNPDAALKYERLAGLKSRKPPGG
jgi:tetratricopeptide (TPR) repeat protein